LTRLIEGRAATSLAGQCELLAARETHRWHHPRKGNEPSMAYEARNRRKLFSS